MRVAEPAADGDGVLGVEDVARRAVVNDDGLAQVAADHAEVFHVVALVVIAALAEQAVVHDVVDVELVEQRVAVLGHRGGEDDDFVELAHALEESVDARAFYYVDVVVLAFDLDGDGHVRLMEDLSSSQRLASKRRNDDSLTLKLLCTSVSSRSSTKHFRPLNSGLSGGSSHVCFSADEATDCW